ncbi:MAG TPA: TadE family protein [Acidimicrobiales bacterium]
MDDHRREERGAVLVEFALILPVLLMLLVGIIEFGRAYNTTVSMQSAAREGARELALRRSAAEVEQAVRDAAPSVEIDAVAQDPCPATGDGEAEVFVTEDFTFGIPFVDLGTKTLSATGVMRCGL